MATERAQRTPGPWRVESAPSGRWIEVYSHVHGPAEDLAQVIGAGNAALIAAAPDLLEACKAMLFTSGDPMRWIETQAMARAAIAKANG